MSHNDVLFVATPFLPEHQPALGVSSLVSILAEGGVSSSIRYLNLEYGNAIGWDTYTKISRECPPHLLLGDMVFAGSLRRDRPIEWDAFDATLRAEWKSQCFYGNVDDLLAEARALTVSSAEWIDRWAGELLAPQPRIVGFTVTFAQTTASLALARELRRRAGDDLIILFGGGNCEGEMGRAIADNFGCVDHVISGEAETIILDVVLRCLSGDRGALPRYILASPVMNMNALPVPAFDDYFRDIRGTKWEQEANLVAESARGCWWGEKSHCTFCGLNGMTMEYRSKSAERVIEELEGLSKRYQRRHFVMADNIVDMRYLNTLFPMLGSRSSDIRLFYETKSNLRKDQLETMVVGGVYGLQPGIESFSTPILHLMAKGTTRLQNIQLLKWCLEYKVDVSWNFLYGFPGESPGEYASMEELLPLLVHLPAPRGRGRVRLDRFSPYWKTPAKFGLTEVHAAWAYRFAFPEVSSADLDRLAYYFDYEYDSDADPEEYVAGCLEEVTRWSTWFIEPAQLAIAGCGERPVVIDTRPCSREREHTLSVCEEAILASADSCRGREVLIAELAKVIGDAATVASTLDELIERRWIIEERGMCLSLVVNPSCYERIIDRKLALGLTWLGLAPQPVAASA